MDENMYAVVFVKPSFEGVMEATIMSEIMNDSADLEIVYTTHVDFTDYTRFQNYNIVVILGFPYKSYSLPNEFYTDNNVPFEDFIHFSTYGSEIEGENIISEVIENQDPVKSLLDLLRNNLDNTILSQYVSITKKAEDLEGAVNSYRTWTWDSSNKRLIDSSLALFNASYTYLPYILGDDDKSLMDVIKENKMIIKGQLDKMKNYIQDKKDKAYSNEVNIEGVTCTLVVTYAEEYINELAHQLLEDYSFKTNNPIIVCIGRQTRSADIFSVRTTGINAGEVAQYINNGSGKEDVGTVFSTFNYSELMGKAFTKSLTKE